METLQEIKDNSAQSQGYNDYNDFIENAPFGFDAIILQTATEYARQACERQRELCAEAADTHYGVEKYEINKQSILNAPLAV